MAIRRNQFFLLLLASPSLVALARAQEAPKPAGSAEEITVSAVPPEENIMPTTGTNSSIYGLDLGVMDTPRSMSMISRAQLDTVNIQDPRSFSYLTSSSFTDAAFGGPNIPRIRGQYADLFVNGGRESFTSTGYGAPVSFNSIETINISKGPAAVSAGNGPGVGGSVDLETKLPYYNEFHGTASVDFDTVDGRRWNLDFGGPIKDTSLAYRISYSGEDSDSYFTNHYKDQHALYAVIAAHPSDSYSIQFDTETVLTNYMENVGINRVNQNLISNGEYLTGLPVGTAVGNNPYANISDFLQQLNLTGTTKLNPRITIDEPGGTGGHALTSFAQLIQTLDLGDGLTLKNNTFFNYLNSDNEAMYYYADSAKNTFSVENKTDLQFKFSTPVSGLTVQSSVDAGIDFRYSHVNYIGNFDNETLSVFDLSGNPNSWVFPASSQFTASSPFPPAFLYGSAEGRLQYGIPGRDSVDGGNTNESDLTDLGTFFEHKLAITPELSILYGLRGDIVQADEHDPLGGPIFNGLPQDHSTDWYANASANISPVYRFAPWGSYYLTYDYTQNVSGGYGLGGIFTIGNPDSQAFEHTSRLYETGLKFNLLDEKLFIGTALFRQQRVIATGPGGSVPDEAKISGAEFELNYQPERHYFVTASYSHIQTTLTEAAGFYDFPAQPGTNYDGAGTLAVFAPGQRFDDPGVPKDVFNFLGNYRFDSGLGLRFGVQITGPVATTTSGQLDLAAIAAAGNISFIPQSVINNHGFYQSPVIPWQYTMNAAIYYDFDRYHINLAINNLTDQKNWEPNDPFYGNDSILRQNPINAELSASVKF
jgi:outer membrane receptor for monomeric catechols